MQFMRPEYMSEFTPMPSETPQFDVILRFDPQAETFFSTLIEQIAQATGNTVRLDSGQPPHVSLGIFNMVGSADPVLVLGDLLRGFRSIPLTFRVVGAFFPGILIVTPSVTEELIYMNRAIHLAADGSFEPLKQYVFGSWVPHLTLAARLDRPQLLGAFDTASLMWRPLMARAVSVSIVHHFPYYSEELVVPLT